MTPPVPLDPIWALLLSIQVTFEVPFHQESLVHWPAPSVTPLVVPFASHVTLLIATSDKLTAVLAASPLTLETNTL